MDMANKRNASANVERKIIIPGSKPKSSYVYKLRNLVHKQRLEQRKKLTTSKKNINPEVESLVSNNTNIRIIHSSDNCNISHRGLILTGRTELESELESEGGTKVQPHIPPIPPTPPC